MKPEQKKPRCDSSLKNLPEERQQEIMEHAAEHGLVKTAAWLREDGLQTSKTAVGNFVSWYPLQLQFRQDEVTTDSLLEQLKAEVPELTDQQLDELGQRTFSLLSLRNQDAETFLAFRSARAKGELERAKLDLRKQAEARMGESLLLEKKRFQRETAEMFLKWNEDRRAKEVATSSASNAEKIEQLGELMFGEDWKK